MQISENPTAFKKYMETLKKIKIIRNKDKHDNIDYVNELISDVNDFVSQYVKGGIRARMSFADLSDKIDYDMRFLLNNLSDSWREDVLYLRDNLRRSARAENSDISTSFFSGKIILLTIAVLAIFLGIRIKTQIDTSYNISTKMGVENAIRIHKKHKRYDRYLNFLSPIPFSIEAWVLWPVKLTAKEVKYYEEYIKLNIDVINALNEKGYICTSVKKYEDMNEMEVKKFIEFLDMPSNYVEKYFAENRGKLDDADYYTPLIKVYSERFPCRNKWNDYPAAR